MRSCRTRYEAEMKAQCIAASHLPGPCSITSVPYCGILPHSVTLATLAHCWYMSTFSLKLNLANRLKVWRTASV